MRPDRAGHYGYRIEQRGDRFVPQGDDGLGYGDLFWRSATTLAEAREWLAVYMAKYAVGHYVIHDEQGAR